MPEDWTAFLKYSSFVRRLGSGLGKSCNLHGSVIDVIGSLRPTLTLLPNLRVLIWHSLELKGVYLPSVLSWVGDRMTGLYISSWEPSTPEHVFRAALAQVSLRSRHLRRFEFDFIGAAWLSSSSTAVSSLVSSLSSLIWMDCSSVALTPEAIVFLAELTSLRSLSVHLPDIATWPHIGCIYSPFPALKKVTLVTTMLGYIAFSKAMPLPHISVLVLQIRNDSAAPFVSEFFTAIRRQFSPDSLDNVDIRPAGVATLSNAQQSTAVVRSADLRPLLDFAALSRFSMHLDCRHAFDDALFLDIAKAWPRLEYFHLATEVYCAHDTLPSLIALAHFAAYAKNLTMLGLVFDAEDWEWGEGEDGHGPAARFYGDLRASGRASTSRVHTLFVARSPIDNPLHISFFLACVFPALDETFNEFEDGENFESAWDKVQESLPLFVRIRKDEQRRIKQDRHLLARRKVAAT